MRKFIIISIIIIAYLFLLCYLGYPLSPPQITPQEVRNLRFKAEEIRYKLRQTIITIEKGTDYIIKNSTLEEMEAREIFFICAEKSYKYNIPLNLLLNIIRVESHFNRMSIGLDGERGLMQPMPRTAKHLCKELNIPYNKDKLFNNTFNIELGCYFLNSLYGRYGNWEKVLSHYNNGKCRNLAYLEKIKKNE